MCGIFGGVDAALDPGRCAALLRHRGPDGEGSSSETLRGRQLTLGHTRLAILDLSEAGRQPMTSQDGRWCVTYNGEIYNHLELRRGLDVTFRGHSDTETLVESLAAHGFERTVRQLNGMFAFAALDRQEGRLYLARDPFGIKPLYYRFVAGRGLIFGSEVRVLRGDDEPKLEIDEDQLQCFLTLRFVPSPKTLWRGVHRLPPGHFLQIGLTDLETELYRYIEPVTERFTGSIDEAVEAYHDLLIQAIRRQLLSDVPVGILLSSGIDSAIVAALAKAAGRELPCYTVGYDPRHPESEIPGAEQTCQALGLPFVPVEVSPSDVLAVVDDIVGTIEEPIVSTAPLVMWHLVKRARQDVTVALTGQGSDEPWGGYTRYQNEMVRPLLLRPELLRVLGVARPLWRHLPEWVDRALRSLPITDRARRFEEAYALFTADQRQALTGRKDDGEALASLTYWLDWQRAANCEPVEEMMRIDTRTCLADDWLLYSDKIAMAVSLEARFPILDLDVVQFVESLPRAYRVKLGRTKIVHKLMAERHLPPAIIHRRKQSFPTPFASWSRGLMRPRVVELLLEELPRDGLMQRPAIERMLSAHLKGSRDLTRQIYALFMLANCRRHLAQ